MNGKKNKLFLQALGYGFAGLDVIKFNKEEFFLPGGTCANVMSALASLGWHTTIIKSAYSDTWNNYIDSVWRKMGVIVNNCHKSKRPTPRVVQEFIGPEHFFYTTCPKCKTMLLNLSLPPTKTIKENLDNINYDFLFYDRMSDGIRYLLSIFNSLKKWTFYEPNSAYSYNTFVNNVAECDIVKFSDKRIPLSVSAKLLPDLKKIKAKTKIVIITHGCMGMSYSIFRNGSYLEYIFLPVKSFMNVVDSSGAGDWVSAGFINNFINIYPTVTDELDEDAVKSALSMGHTQAEQCCSSIGAIGRLIKNIRINVPNDVSKCQYCKI